MGIPVLILGESGAGKTCSLRNFEKGEVFIFDVAGKPLPFRKKLDTECNSTYESIGRKLKKTEYKSYVIDDSQYLLAFELFDRSKEKGYDKFTDIAVRFRNCISYISKYLPDDIIVYFFHHTECSESGRIKAKTVGRMLDNQLTVEGLFSIVLLAKTDGQEYFFETQSDGFTTCKSPLDMFESRITDNDLKFVDKTIRQYWGLEGGKENEKVGA